MAGGIVMISNLCFSFRGLYQKLFRKQEIVVMDDLNLQYRMQQMGVALFIVPVLLQHLLFSSSLSTTTMMENSGPNASSYMSYWLLALVNGCAFTCYNLASTYILSRISVVHHAAINCIRRVFAIVVTSILFGVPITLGGGIGIALAVVGFMSYTHFKILQQQSKQPPTSTTTIPSHPQELLPPVSSLLPVSAHANNQHRHYHYK
jgi:drug/metabolite transporter (DMT)-like permease